LLFLKVLRAIEDPGIAGEMFSSAAAYDPTFWPLHGQIERIVGAKRIMISQEALPILMKRGHIQNIIRHRVLPI